ncbi:MAG: hypothetical protein Q9222_005421 [Ikaeria aurantiellina]
MATQAALIADTIAGMKRVISRDHHCYHRDVISQNPKRYDNNGDELDDDEEDEEADAAAAQVNPYDGIILQDLLAPLTSAAELQSHPSLSTTYSSPILRNMTQEACEMLQRERNTIRSAKQLLTVLRGDNVWIPCATLDSEIDDVIFDTEKVYNECIRSCPSTKLSIKGSGKAFDDHPLAPTEDGSIGNADAYQDATKAEGNDRGSTLAPEQYTTRLAAENTNGSKSTLTTMSEAENIQDHTQDTNARLRGGNGETTDRQDFQNTENTRRSNSPLPATQKLQNSSEDATETINGTIGSSRPLDTNGDTRMDTDVEAAIEMTATGSENPQQHTTSHVSDADDKTSMPAIQSTDVPDGHSTDIQENVNMTEADESENANGGLQPIGHRMTTRAQAQAVSENNTSSRTRSPSNASSIVPSIHPLFLMPDGACPDRDWGLPPEEAEATRRLLMSYVQKQEEVCRGAERLYNGFLKAERMKKTVYDSCKAEAHVGEMSDGEDWYDKEEWGLDEDLRKGHEEEEEDTHKKTRQRRAAA